MALRRSHRRHRPLPTCALFNIWHLGRFCQALTTATATCAGCLRAIMASWGVWPAYSWLSDPAHVGLELELEEASCKWFPASQSAKHVRDALVRACIRRGVRIRYNAHVTQLSPAAEAHEAWDIRMADGQTVLSERVILATGGLSFPAVGTDGAGHTMARQVCRSNCLFAAACGVVTAHRTPGVLLVVLCCRPSIPPLVDLQHSRSILREVDFLASQKRDSALVASLQLGLAMEPTFPALTPLKGRHPGSEPLAGVSCNVRARAATGAKSWRHAPRTGFLFTHSGYSGPAILDLSHHAVRALDRADGKTPKLTVNWTGDDADAWRARLSSREAQPQRVLRQLRAHVPQRLATAVCDDLGVLGKNCGDLTKGERAAIVEALVAYPLPYNGHLGCDWIAMMQEACEGGDGCRHLPASPLVIRTVPGCFVFSNVASLAATSRPPTDAHALRARSYKMAEVTGGGVRLDELDCKTMATRKAPGVYVCGEICDVFGRIGGFNFYWAWVSGRAAGLGCAGVDWADCEV